MICLIAIDALPQSHVSLEKSYEVYGSRIDATLKYYKKPPRAYDIDLTFEKALEL